MSQSTENAGQAAKGKILVVDDESDLRAAFKIILTDEGFSVITAADGMEGVQKKQGERSRRDHPGS